MPSADNAAALGGLPASSYISTIHVQRVATATDARHVKGPLAAHCPANARVLSGGAAIEGATRGTSLVVNAPQGSGDWVGVATADRRARPAWRLVVTAICATTGQ